MQIEAHTNSLFNSVTYRFGAMIVDPGDVWRFEGALNVLLTHAHFDHIYGLNELLRLSPTAKVFTNASGREMLLDARKNMSFYNESPFVFDHPDRVVVVEEGDEVCLGEGLVALAVFTPGHNPSCITWVVGDAVFSGDALIPGVKTVTNLPGGDKVAAARSEERIRALKGARTLYPGHPANPSPS